MLNPNEIKGAIYNPRIFMPDNYESLGDSMEEFGDISGITFNTGTGNLVTGHNRWNLLCQMYGIESLSLRPIDGTDIYVICESGYATGYTLRSVNWELDKEKLANITANSDSVTGVFTSDIKNLLNSVSNDNNALISKLKLNNIRVPKIKPLSNIEKSSDKDTKVIKKSETVISGGGETYLTIKLELTPETAKSFQKMLVDYRLKGDSVEDPIKRIINFVYRHEIEHVTKTTRTRKNNN